VKPFFTQNDLAGALVAVTAVAAVLVEWAVTVRERLAGEPGGWRRLQLAGAALGEVTLLRTGERRAEDRGTKWVLVATAVAGFLLAAAAQRRAPGLAFATTGWGPTLIGVAIIWAGVLLRGWAIATLGRFFRRDIQVAADQPVVSTGPYAAIRHPAYAGNMLTFAGAGVLLANWGSLAALVTVPLVGVVRRITIEEALVAGRLGEPYRRYAARTARLVPHVW
jgi:protein-S-isoprenylcysteine O-methyltransferase Ste14